MKNMKLRRLMLVLIACVLTFTLGSFSARMADTPDEQSATAASSEEAEVSAADDTAEDDAIPGDDASAEDDAIPEEKAEDGEETEEMMILTTGIDEEESEEDAAAADLEAAYEYVDDYAGNLESDPDFDTNVEAAIATIRTDVKSYATFVSLLPALIAIVLALITKEVYSSLVIGIVVGGAIWANGNFEKTVTHVISDGFIGNLADSYNMGIILFLVLLGALVAMMNKAGGSAAFGRWATKHIKTRTGAQLATVALGVLIFIDDYFNCLTVGSVMRPVTDEHKISRAKLSYLIDATAAPVCIIAPISSWAAAVAGFARGAGADSGMSLFLQAIPYNFYALLTIVMMIFLAVTSFDYGPMKKHEANARENGDLFTSGTKQAVEEMQANPKGKVIDLIIPVLVLIVCCVIGMIYSGGFFSGANFIDAFSDSDASVGLAYGAFIAIIIAVIYFLIRRVISFKEIMESLPEGFKAMVSAIMILACAWTLKAMTDSLGAKIFISQIIEGSAGSLSKFLPAIIFLIAVGLSFATGTSWGTFGILIPIVLSVFKPGDPIMIVAISACMAGAVCGDHCSPISDTTIMSSAGAQCDHINHVSTQLPYALTVAAFSFVTYILAGFVPKWYIALPFGIVLTVVALFIMKLTMGKKKAA